MNWRTTTIALVAIAASAAACGPTPAEQTGELGNGTFGYPCDSSTVTCDPTNHATPFPTAVVSGAKFVIDFERSDEKADIYTPQPIATAIIDLAPDGSMTANREGWGGFYVQNLNNQLIDFSEVKIVKASTIKINAHSPNAFTADVNDFSSLPISLSTVEGTPVFDLYANLYSSSNELLAGEIQLDFTIDDTSIASISNVSGHRAQITGLKIGTANLTIAGAGVTRTAAIQVTQ